MTRRRYPAALGAVLAGAALLAAAAAPDASRAGAKAPTEAALWDRQKAHAAAALAFWRDFLDLREGKDNSQPLSAAYQENLGCIIRAVSWVESRHGTAGANQPARDPMQSGNPRDQWWKSVRGKLGDSDRFIRGPKFPTNFWARELPAAAASAPGFPADARLSVLTDAAKGHDDAKFNPAMSYAWGVALLIHRINTGVPGGKAYKCDTYSRARLLDGAVAYNGGGDPQYRAKLENALAGGIGCRLP